MIRNLINNIADILVYECDFSVEAALMAPRARRRPRRCTRSARVSEVSDRYGRRKGIMTIPISFNFRIGSEVLPGSSKKYCSDSPESSLIFFLPLRQLFSRDRSPIF